MGETMRGLAGITIALMISGCTTVGGIDTSQLPPAATEVSVQAFEGTWEGRWTVTQKKAKMIVDLEGGKGGIITVYHGGWHTKEAEMGRVTTDEGALSFPYRKHERFTFTLHDAVVKGVYEKRGKAPIKLYMRRMP